MPQKKEIHFACEDMRIQNNEDFEKIQNILDTNVFFHDSLCTKACVKKIQELKPGDVLILENLRFYPEEISGS